MKEFCIAHLIKSEDLNHHGTLFAGRTAEWLVEAAFIAAASEHGRPQDILCVNVHGFTFKKSVQKGDIISLKSRIVRVGTTSITVYVGATSNLDGDSHVEGFVTFVSVETDTKRAKPHGIQMDGTKDPEELELRRRGEEIYQAR